MNGYRIWGRIEHTAPGEFAVIVSAVPENPADRWDVLLGVKGSREDARQEVAALAVAMGEKVRERGGVVVDVEIDI